MLDLILFAVFPYVAIVVAVVGLLWRYRTNQFSFSSVSSQFLENRQLFWGSVPWHYGIILILIGHLIGVFFPSGVKAFNSVPVRLYILEGTALALGLLLTWGLVALIWRRINNPRIRITTSRMDVVLLALLLLQVVTGVTIAITTRWGTAWFVQTATPYLWSLAKLSPNLDLIAPLSLIVKIHAVNATVLIALWPFTRLVHIVSIPVAYLWRPYQVAIWYYRRIQQ
ncbi:MAG: respiratory nitrate reductase subunit gamma [Chloroflexi bacterium]|nr:respiratory nitrate reductase subunit gamma [Chloroflexota bacterium]